MTRGDWQWLLHIRTYCEDIEKFIIRFGQDFNTLLGPKNRRTDVSCSAVFKCVCERSGGSVNPGG